MLTLFTTAKPFKGHNGIIQRNALKSWKLLDPDAEVIVFGDDEGAAEVCSELGLRHEPEVARTEFGSIRLDDMFSKAQALAKYDVVCYANCDIILMGDFRRAISQTKARYSRFLVVGRRWDTDIAEPIDFSIPNWQEETRRRALAARRQRDPWWIDYFAFSRGLYAAEMPPFAIGRTCWDNWLAWKGSELGCLVDASASVVAVHQNHDYGHHPQGAAGVWDGQEARRNFALAGGWGHLRTIAEATLILKDGEFKKNRARSWRALQRRAKGLGLEAQRVLTYRVWLPLWHSLLGVTRPLRHALGLRSKGTR
jgi:hypothetical protein